MFSTSYSRARDLPGVLPLWPAELTDQSVAGLLAVIAKLEKACLSESARGAAGHWTYDSTRHRQLIAALESERRELQAIQSQRAA